MILKRDILVGLFIFFLVTSTNTYAVDKEVSLDAESEECLTIKGIITHVPPDSSSDIHLYTFYGKELSKIESTRVNDRGEFVFKLMDTPKQGLYKIGLDKQNSATIVLSQTGDLLIKADYRLLQADKIIVVNSRENNAYRKLLKVWNQMQKKMVKIDYLKNSLSHKDPFIMQKRNVIDENIRRLIQDYNVDLLTIKGDYPKTFTSEVLINLSFLPQLADHEQLEKTYDSEQAFLHDYFFEFIDFSDDRIIRTPFLAEKYSTYLAQFTDHTPERLKDSVDMILNKAVRNSTVHDFTIEFLINLFSKRGLAELENYIIDNYVQVCDKPLSERTIQMVNRLECLRVGRKAPEIILEDSEGNAIRLSSSIRKNKVLMLYFWASWCEACKAENLHIVNIYNKFKEKGLGIYGVALDFDKNEWVSAIKDYQLPWTNVSDLKQWDSEIVKVYNVNQTPTIYLVDNKGIITAKNLRGNTLENKLKELLN
ncbi:MAG: redoxin domain-containing protein [Candidatus Scalindua sp.]|nr:redoxin domain-containing protein [Candidatus Scalindua sp.]